MDDIRIEKMIKFIKKLQLGNYNTNITIEGNDTFTKLQKALNEMSVNIKKQMLQKQALSEVVKKINQGHSLIEVLTYIYEDFQNIIPYDRIGVAFLGENQERLVAHWSKSKSSNIKLVEGYSASMKGRSLEKILQTGQPRILNNLQKHLQEHPNSEPTKLIVEEGMLSSLTCPLIASNKPIGFIFFSSMQVNTYEKIHRELFLQIADAISVIIDKSRLFDRLVELNDLKNKFLGVAAHDLRNPLGIIKGNAEIMLDGLLGEFSKEQKETIEVIQKSCEKMINLINTFLNVSVIESGNLELKKEKISVLEFLKQCVDMNQMFAKAKSIVLKLEAQGGLPDIEIDKERIDQVMNNLITNALKFSKPNTVITLQASKKEGAILISVKDQGQGVPKEEIPKLFAFFSKTSTKPTANEKSTGLGLAISKRIIEAHGGKIWAENNADVGCSFTFSIPL